eukprot:7336175-Pyramimonas_sp.AAC.2
MARVTLRACRSVSLMWVGGLKAAVVGLRSGKYAGGVMRWDGQPTYGTELDTMLMEGDFAKYGDWREEIPRTSTFDGSRGKT